MFVPVSCTSCGKPFQVPEAALGKLTPCPWCQAAVTALPVSDPQPESQPAAAPESPKPLAVAPEPLSLDDAPAGEQKPTMKSVATLSDRSAAPATPVAPPARPRRLPLLFKLVFLVFLTGAVAAATVGVLRWKSGHVLDMEWKQFSAPDGSCAVELLGRPVADPVEPGAGRRYTAEGWYSGTKTWIGWKDLRPDEALLLTELAAAEQAHKVWEGLNPNVRGKAPPLPSGWHQFRVSIFDPEIERLKSTFGGHVVKDATSQFDPLTVEVRLETPNGPLVERIVVTADGPRPRAYFVGMTGRRLNPDGPEVGRLFASFRVNG